MIYVQRELVKKDNKEFYAYFIEGVVRGKDVKVLISAPDFGGYKVLDIVFGNEMSAELVLKPYEIKDDKTGQVLKGNTYAVRSVDEDGIVYECPIKPARVSDKTALNMFLR